MTVSNTDALCAGAAEIDITPAKGIHMGGDLCRFRPVEKVLDPLYARALVLETGSGSKNRRICLLTLDLCTPGNEVSDEIRQLAAERFGFDAKAIMFHLLQNHSAPSLGTHHLFRPDSPYVRPDFWWVYTGDPKYHDYLVPKIMEVIGQAIERMEPVSMACGGMCDGRVAFNRRFVMRDGWVQTQPGDLSQILHPEGPADPEVGVACFKTRSNRIVAAILHHTAHPVSYFGKNWVTASWPGSWARQFKEAIGEECVPLIVNGCCGNINSRNPLVPSYETNDQLIGEWLTETSQKVIEQLTWQDNGDIGFATHKMDMPFEKVEKTVGKKAIERARRTLENEPEPRWSNEEHTAIDIEWLFAAVILDLERRTKSGSYTYEVQTFRMGELGLVGLIGEPFVEGQLKIKLESPARRTFVAHMCNGWVGYIPPIHAHNAKNFNFRTADGEPVRRGANLFLLGPGALDQITDKSVELLGELFST